MGYVMYTPSGNSGPIRHRPGRGNRRLGLRARNRAGAVAAWFVNKGAGAALQEGLGRFLANSLLARFSSAITLGLVVGAILDVTLVGELHLGTITLTPLHVLAFAAVGAVLGGAGGGTGALLGALWGWVLAQIADSIASELITGPAADRLARPLALCVAALGGWVIGWVVGELVEGLYGVWAVVLSIGFLVAAPVVLFVSQVRTAWPDRIASRSIIAAIAVIAAAALGLWIIAHLVVALVLAFAHISWVRGSVSALLILAGLTVMIGIVGLALWVAGRAWGYRERSGSPGANSSGDWSPFFVLVFLLIRYLTPLGNIMGEAIGRRATRVPKPKRRTRGAAPPASESESAEALRSSAMAFIESRLASSHDSSLRKTLDSLRQAPPNSDAIKDILLSSTLLSEGSREPNRSDSDAASETNFEREYLMRLGAIVATITIACVTLAACSFPAARDDWWRIIGIAGYVLGGLSAILAGLLIWFADTILKPIALPRYY